MLEGDTLRKANINVFMVLFLFIFFTVTTFSVEWYRIYTLKEYVDTEISRALNIAVDVVMLDEYRMEHISKINTTLAKAEFKDYLFSEMKLNSFYERVESGKTVYKIKINKEILEETPARYEVRGSLVTKPILLSKIVNFDIEIPFKQTSRNQRFE